LIDSAMLDAVLAALFGFGALAGGFAAAKLNKGAGLVAGALTGAAMLLLLLLTAAVRNQADFSSVFLMKLAAARSN
jgi:putative membrane protein (TIGR04086 family)